MMRDHKLSGLSNGYGFPVLEVRGIGWKCYSAALALEVQGRVLLASSGFWWLLASPDGGRITTVPIDFQVTCLCISAPCLLTPTLIIWFEVTTIQCDLILDNDIGKDPISKWGCRAREPPESAFCRREKILAPDCLLHLYPLIPSYFSSLFVWLVLFFV